MGLWMFPVAVTEIFLEEQEPFMTHLPMHILELGSENPKQTQVGGYVFCHGETYTPKKKARPAMFFKTHTQMAVVVDVWIHTCFT